MSSAPADRRLLVLTADLATSSRVVGAALRQGLVADTLMGWSAAAEKVDAVRYELAVIDLTLPKLEIGPVVATLRAAPEPPREIIAFGPHVHEALLQSAQEAGCDRVMARGQFYAQLDNLLARRATEA